VAAASQVKQAVGPGLHGHHVTFDTKCYVFGMEYQITALYAASAFAASD
jgi:hypothetical protein